MRKKFDYDPVAGVGIAPLFDSSGCNAARAWSDRDPYALLSNTTAGAIVDSAPNLPPRQESNLQPRFWSSVVRGKAEVKPHFTVSLRWLSRRFWRQLSPPIRPLSATCRAGRAPSGASSDARAANPDRGANLTTL